MKSADPTILIGANGPNNHQGTGQMDSANWWQTVRTEIEPTDGITKKCMAGGLKHERTGRSCSLFWLQLCPLHSNSQENTLGSILYECAFHMQTKLLIMA